MRINKNYLLVLLATIALGLLLGIGHVDLGQYETGAALALTGFIGSIAAYEIGVKVSKKPKEELRVDREDFRRKKPPTILEWLVSLYVLAYGGVFAYLSYVLYLQLFGQIFLKGGSLYDTGISLPLALTSIMAAIAATLIVRWVRLLKRLWRRRRGY